MHRRRRVDIPDAPDRADPGGAGDGEGGEGEGGKPRNQPGDQPGEADTPSQDQESKLREKNAGGGREASTRRRFDEQVNDDPQGYVEKPW